VPRLGHLKRDSDGVKVGKAVVNRSAIRDQTGFRHRSTARFVETCWSVRRARAMMTADGQVRGSRTRNSNVY
jgi:hypothetical protein